MSKTKAIKFIDDNLEHCSKQLRKLEKLPLFILESQPHLRADGKAYSMLAITLKELKDILELGE